MRGRYREVERVGLPTTRLSVYGVYGRAKKAVTGLGLGQPGLPRLGEVFQLGFMGYGLSLSAAFPG